MFRSNLLYLAVDSNSTQIRRRKYVSAGPEYQKRPRKTHGVVLPGFHQRSTMSGPTVFGPCRPMSTWPLDHVPGPILDLVAWYIINLEKHENTEIAHIDKPKDGGSIFPHRPAHHPFSRDMQACSLVDKSFRHAFVKDGIFSHVVLKKKKQCRLVSKQLGPGARSYVT